MRVISGKTTRVGLIHRMKEEKLVRSQGEGKGEGDTIWNIFIFHSWREKYFFGPTLGWIGAISVHQIYVYHVQPEMINF